MKIFYLFLMIFGIILSPSSFSGTYLVKDIHPEWSSTPWSLIDVNGLLFFNANDGTGDELWKSDGTLEGTQQVKDIDPYIDSFRWDLVSVNNIVFFGADDGIHGWELWKSDGTPEGTVMVKDIKTGMGSSMPTAMANIGGILFFSATGSGGYELWKSDGTEQTTRLVKNINPKGDGGPYAITDVDGIAFFIANDGLHGWELWKSDGTEPGTVLVKDINSTGLSNISGLTQVKGELFFTANDGSHGKELWKSDGTTMGTVMVKDINPQGDAMPWYLTDQEGALFFVANDGVHGIELWKSDGTPEGTVMVKDIHPTGSSEPYYLTMEKGEIFFSAQDGFHGRELWKSDGTAEGTLMIKNINQQVNEGSFPGYFTRVNDEIFFRARDESHGMELWKSDGTEAGTVLVSDINTGAGAMGSSYPEHLKEIDGTLFFSAIGTPQGRELFAIKPTLDFTLTHSHIAEHLPIGRIISYFTPLRRGNTFQLVAGQGDDDNHLFSITANTLKTNAVFDYETQRLFHIRVQSSVEQQGHLEKRFVITLKKSGAPEPPAWIELELAIILGGKGKGIVMSDPSGIDCGIQCQSRFRNGSMVSLLATSAADSIFTGWSGDCQGSSDITDLLMISKNRFICHANFDLLPPTQVNLTLIRLGSGEGSVNLSETSCEEIVCSYSIESRKEITLTAVPFRGTNFTGWDGACQGTEPTIHITMDQSKTCTAYFEKM